MSADNIAKWIYKKGLEDNIILYSKVSIYRNIDNIRFYNHIDKDDIEKIDNKILKEYNGNILLMKEVGIC